ncbi:unnamed protein product [Phytomonas sp. EM1]|nr:unnamed protein product [Phytomonas sp. EM1]|eukprot:CCW64178.1 unnamed protein product [Phytomonas sp. isolate EM1]
MLFIRCELNGVPLVAFVDTGAAVSVLTTSAVEKCALTHLLDRRFSGMIQGVGTQQCIGAIHMIPVNVSGLFIPFSFRILDQMLYEVIIGLDQLRRHQAGIDLQKGVLRLSGHEIPFLHEWEVRELNATRDRLAVAAEEGSGSKGEQTAPPQSSCTAGEEEKEETPTPTRGGPQQQTCEQNQTIHRENDPNPNESRDEKVEVAENPSGARDDKSEAAPISALRSYTDFQQRMAQQLMEFVGLPSLDAAYELLDAAQWDLDAAAALNYKSDEEES